MKELWPNKKFGLISFSPCIQESLDKSDVNSSQLDGIGEINSDGTFALISKASSLEIVNIKNGQRISAFNFEIQLPKWKITSYCTCGQRYLLALTPLDPSQKNGMLCFYDPGVSKVVKCIKLPFKPSSHCLIKEFGGAGHPSNFVSDAFKFMFGMVAIGSSCGHIYILDLRNDDRKEYFSFSKPSEILLIQPSDISNVAENRELAKNSGKHCCIDLSDEFCYQNVFKYVDPEKGMVKLFHEGSFGVTALKYLPKTTSLVVGYQFGCFQMFSMTTLQLLHSSQVGSPIPVTNFSFQEPDDDPRSCCYLWVGRGPTSTASGENNNVPTSISLCQLLYEEKEYKPSYGTLYKEFECAIKRFHHQLTSDVYHLVDSHSTGSRIITMKSIGQDNALSTTSTDDSSTRSDSTLCYVVWETPGIEKEMTCHLGIFDINRWYQKQLPSTVRDAMYGRMEPVCPFFAFYSLSDIAEDFLPNGILDVHLDKNSFNPFQNIVGPQSEQFYWPSSAMFSATCISESSSINIEMLGVQRQIIADIRKAGTDSFVDSKEIIQNCWVAGLIQNTADITRAIDDKRNADAVLSVNMEHGGINFITNCVKKWAHGSITHAGHSLKLIYDWAWNHTIHTKKNFDQLYGPLFQSSTEKLEPEHNNQLKRISMDIHQLCEVFRELHRADTLSVPEGEEELATRMKIASYLDTYCGLILLLVDCQLLPEQQPRLETVENEDCTESINYPFKTLCDYYAMRRDEATILGKNGEEICLFVDLLFDRFVSKLNTDATEDSAMEEDINPKLTQYPPKTIEKMCHIFVENYCDDNLQMMIFYYWVLDICECFEDFQSKQVSKKFRTALILSPDEVLLVESMWLIDHKLYKDAAEHLSLINSKVPSRYYTHIVRTLYQVGQLSLLVMFCSCKEPIDCCTYEEVKFLIEIFLRVKLLDNAYKLQSNFSNHLKKPLLFNHFVEKCKENKLLGKLVTLSLSNEEEDLLKRILKRSPDNRDYLLVYYLERGHYSDAYNITREIRNSAKWQRLRATLLSTDHQFDDRKAKTLSFDQMETKGLLVDGFIQTVPDIEKKKLNLIEARATSRNSSLRKSVEQKLPLSTVCGRLGPHKSRNQSSDILSTLYDNDLSGELLDTSVFLESIGGNQRRRKSPLFDGELTSPKKKQKEMPTPSIQASPATDPSKLTTRYKKEFYQGKDAFLLLSTPPNVRRVKQANAVNLSITSERLKTPQSILKTRGKSRIQQQLQSQQETSVISSKPPLIIQTPNDTPSRKIRFIGLSPTLPSTPNISQNSSLKQQEEQVEKESPLKAFQMSNDQDSQSEVEKLLLDLSKEDESTVEKSYSEHDTNDVEALLLELSRDEMDMDDGAPWDQTKTNNEENSHHELLNKQKQHYSFSKQELPERTIESTTVQDTTQKDPILEVNQIKTCHQQQKVSENLTDKDVNPVDENEDIVIINLDDSPVKAQHVQQQQHETFQPVHSASETDAATVHSSDEESDGNYLSVGESELIEQELENKSREKEESELDKNEGPELNENEGPELNEEEEPIVLELDSDDDEMATVRTDYEMVQYDDGNNKTVVKSAFIIDQESVHEEDFVKQNDYDMLEGEEIDERNEGDNGENEKLAETENQNVLLAQRTDVSESVVENIEEEEGKINPVIDVKDDMENPIDQEAISKSTNEEPRLTPVNENEGTNIISEVKISEASSKDDFEMIVDSFSEGGNTYGEKSVLFVDEGPISSTFVEVDSYSEYHGGSATQQDEDSTFGAVKNLKPVVLLEHLIGINSANETIVSESTNPSESLAFITMNSDVNDGGPNENISTTMDESTTSTTSTMKKRTRRSHQPPVSSRRMTRSATKKMEQSVFEEPELEIKHHDDINSTSMASKSSYQKVDDTKTQKSTPNSKISKVRNNGQHSDGSDKNQVPQNLINKKLEFSAVVDRTEPVNTSIARSTRSRRRQTQEHFEEPLVSPVPGEIPTKEEFSTESLDVAPNEKQFTNESSELENTEKTTSTRGTRTTPRKTRGSGKTSNTPTRSPSRRRTIHAENTKVTIPTLLEDITEGEDGFLKISTATTDTNQMTRVTRKTTTSAIDNNVTITETTAVTTKTTKRRSAERLDSSHEVLELANSSITKTRTRKNEKQEKDGSKLDTSTESILSFEKKDESHSPKSLTLTTTRTSKRSSSKRASLAISDLTRTRKSTRSKNTE